MKKYTFILLCALACACTHTKEPEAPTLIGTWTNVEGGDKDATLSIGTVYEWTFKEDSTMHQLCIGEGRLGSRTETIRMECDGTWHYDGSVLSLHTEEYTENGVVKHYASSPSYYVTKLTHDTLQIMMVSELRDFIRKQ